MVYFMREDGENGAIKIGYTANNSGDRQSELQTGNSKALNTIGVIEGGRAVEQALHVRFSHLRIRGEWFRADLELLAFIEGVLWCAGGVLGAAAASSATNRTKSTEFDVADTESLEVLADVHLDVVAVGQDKSVYKQLMKEHAKRVVDAALVKCAGNKGRAAKALGLSREGFYGILNSSAYYQDRRARGKT